MTKWFYPCRLSCVEISAVKALPPPVSAVWTDWKNSKTFNSSQICQMRNEHSAGSTLQGALMTHAMRCWPLSDLKFSSLRALMPPLAPAPALRQPQQAKFAQPRQVTWSCTAPASSRWSCLL